MKYALKQDIKQLLAVLERPSVTIYMPTHRSSSPPHVQEGITRYKNLVNKVEKQLDQQQVSSDQKQVIMKKLLGLATNQEFWLHQSDGLAVLANRKLFQMFNLSVSIDEYYSLDDHFHLSPLMVQMEENQSYTVLALAVHDPKVFVGDAVILRPSDLKLPENPEKAFNIDEMHINKLQSRGVRVKQPNSGGAPGIFSGHGGSPEDAANEARLRYFKTIDEVLCSKLDASSPLVIMGTTDHVAEYKSITKYKNLVPSSVDGNRTVEQLPDIHRLTWRIVQQDIVQAKRDQILEQYDNLKGIQRASAVSGEVQTAALKGRVDTLLLGMSLYTTDTIAEEIETTAKITFPSEYDLMESVARSVYKQSGKVIGISRELMPEQAAMAAVLRY